MTTGRSLYRLYIRSQTSVSFHYTPLRSSTLYGTKGVTMFDLSLFALGIACFALTLGYAFACERL
jgi:hypothetical protein